MKLVTLDQASKTYLSQRFSTMILDHQVYLVSGDNGSGKTTLIKLITGHIKTDVGIRDGIKTQIAYLKEKIALPEYLRVEAYISLLHVFHQNDMIEFLKSSQIPMHKKCIELSKGNRQKLAILAVATLNAKLYVFDEPLNGLDQYGIEWFKKMIKKLKKMNKAVMIVSHKPNVFKKIADVWIQL